MKKILSVFLIYAIIFPCLSWGAVTVKKAAPVATKQADKMETATSLLPTVIGLVGSVKQLNAQQQQLTADCAPTSDEIELVNELVKEWAKMGDTDAGTLSASLHMCQGTTYQEFMRTAEGDEVCFDHYKSDEGYIWDGYPIASKTDKCRGDDKQTCSNIYEVFAKIPMTNEDYTEREGQKITKLMEKYERCAPAKIKAAKRELSMGFLTGALSGIGQSSGAAGTGSVINAVSSMGGSGSIGSLLPSFGSMATQMLDK